MKVQGFASSAVGYWTVVLAIKRYGLSIKSGLLALCFCVFCAGEVSAFGSQTVNGVTFSCTAVPQANIRGVTSATDVHTKVVNTAGVRMAMRYRVVLTSTANQKFESGQMGKRLGIGGADPFVFTPFSKVGAQDEFPTTCQFTQIQVCPADPPANWVQTHGNAYFDSFINGPASCRRVADLPPVNLPVKRAAGGCPLKSQIGFCTWTEYYEALSKDYDARSPKYDWNDPNRPSMDQHQAALKSYATEFNNRATAIKWQEDSINIHRGTDTQALSIGPFTYQVSLEGGNEVWTQSNTGKTGVLYDCYSSRDYPGGHIAFLEPGGSFTASAPTPSIASVSITCRVAVAEN